MFLTKTAKCWSRLPEVLTYEEVECILNQPDIATFNGLRNKAILEVLYGAGLRASKLCGLRIQDVSPEDGFYLLRVFGKGEKEL